MKYFNIITLFVGVIVNIALYITTPKYIGIGISENGEVSAVGNLNEDGEKEGYWFYLDSFDSKKITTIVGHYTDNKADSLWINLYGDKYIFGSIAVRSGDDITIDGGGNTVDLHDEVRGEGDLHI